MKKNMIWVLALIIVAFVAYQLGRSSVHCEKATETSPSAEGACGLPTVQPPMPTATPVVAPNSSHM